MKPIEIDESVKTTCLHLIEQCGGKGVPDSPFVIRIKRAGQCHYLLEYDGKVKGDTICFNWDRLFYDLPCGRYVGDIFEEKANLCFSPIIASVQFQLNTSFWQSALIKEAEKEELPACEKPKCDCGEENE